MDGKKRGTYRLTDRMKEYVAYKETYKNFFKIKGILLFKVIFQKTSYFRPQQGQLQVGS